ALTSAGGRDAFVARFDATGKALWGKRFGDTRDQIADSVAFVRGGDIVVGGGFDGIIDLGTGPVGGGGIAKFVSRLASNGTARWVTPFGSGRLYDWTTVAADKNGGVAIGGEFVGGISFGGPTLSCAGLNDLFFAMMDDKGGFS